MEQAQRRNLADLRRRHESLDGRLRHQDMRVRLSAMRRQLEARHERIADAIGTPPGRKEDARPNELAASVGRAAETILLRQRSRWELLHSSLNGLSPKAILARGYALVFDAAGNLVKEAAQLKTGDAVRAQLAQGEFTATVDGTKPSSDHRVGHPEILI